MHGGGKIHCEVIVRICRKESLWGSYFKLRRGCMKCGVISEGCSGFIRNHPMKSRVENVERIVYSRRKYYCYH